ncbi:MAG: glucose-1-phosphate thymidylyltransferase [Bacteroidetes bacterium]|nr:MAG: glucose-1-phosphate thymidylyltransferase [Bacteroidota bacterium]MBL1145279.1 glucose-1-phosphate thymidylyltransferase [Bacteroidota bacterium]MCB0803853.1 GlmU family protein [Flavobacteriales bacterium]NOG58075.1 glucose-1-phosphate thymidylyltransferase [Bacteroidota bacterium]
MNYILFDDRRVDLLPFTFTRPVSEIRCGILTITEKWAHHLDGDISFLTEEYLQAKYPVHYASDNTYINGTIFPDDNLLEMINRLEEGDLIFHQEKEKVLAFKTAQKVEFDSIELHHFTQHNFEEDILDINNVWDIFSKNAEALSKDFQLLTHGRTSQALDSTNTHIGNQIFIEEGATVQGAILNSTSGPIYIGKNAEIMEGSVVRGGLALCEGAALKLGTKVYGATTVGPHSKIGGEVNNSVIFGYSNKGHDGFLGNSVLGEWCNLGADTNVSNLKNNYAEIKIWNYEKMGFKNTGLQFCGMMMGDHSKSGINTMFNTATVVGVSSNIYGGGFPRNFIPSFAWGGAEKWVEFRTNKAFEVAEKMMERRGIPFTDIDKAILTYVFENTKDNRNF